MKKLSKFEKGFAALENKELENLESVSGGRWTVQSIRHTNPGDAGQPLKL